MLRSSSANGAAADLTKGSLLSAKLRSFFSFDIIRPKQVPPILQSPKSTTTAPKRDSNRKQTTRTSLPSLPSTEQSMVPTGGLPNIKGATGMRKVNNRTPPPSVTRGNSNLVSIGGVGKGGGPLSQSPINSPTSVKQTMAAAGRPSGGRPSMGQSSLASLMGGMSLSSSDQRDPRSVAPSMTKGNKPEYPAGSTSTSSWSSTTLASLSPYSVSKSQLPPTGQQQSQSQASQLPATVQSTTGTGTTAAPFTKGLCCDKCDGKHETDNCPYYKKGD